MQRMQTIELQRRTIEIVSAEAMAQQPLPMEEWWRPIPRTPTTETYVTGAAALNIPHGELCAGWHGLMWHMRIAGDGDAIERANRARMGRADKWPYWDETSLRDTRKGLAEIGHPAARRTEPIWATTFARVAAEWTVEMAIARGEAWAYPEPREIWAWLETNKQKDELRELLGKAVKAHGDLKERIQTWQERVGI